jgi:hypothetical protein
MVCGCLPATATVLSKLQTSSAISKAHMSFAQQTAPNELLGADVAADVAPELLGAGTAAVAAQGNSRSRGRAASRAASRVRGRVRGRGGSRRGRNVTAAHDRDEFRRSPAEGWKACSGGIERKLSLDAEFVDGILSERARLFCQAAVSKIEIELKVRRLPHSRAGHLILLMDELLQLCLSWLNELITLRNGSNNHTEV